MVSFALFKCLRYPRFQHHVDMGVLTASDFADNNLAGPSTATDLLVDCGNRGMAVLRLLII